MIKEIIYPTQQNISIWLNTLYLFLLLLWGKATPVTIVFVYFLETIIIGIFNVLKMVWCAHYCDRKNYGLALFFMVHYGFFIAIQSVFGFSLFEIDYTTMFKHPFKLIKNYGIILGLEGMNYAIISMILVYIKKFTSDFIRNKKYKKFNPEDIMIKPYIRIFVQQFVVILSFFFLIIDSGKGYAAAVLLIILRLFLDLTLEAIRENSRVLNFLAEKLSNEKISPETIKKHLIVFTE